MKTFPKIELHLHLDCSLSFKVASCLDRSLTRQEFDVEFSAPSQCSSLADFLTRVPRGFQLMQTEEALRLVIEDLFEQLAAGNMIYAEIRFAPLLHIRRGLTPEALYVDPRCWALGAGASLIAPARLRLKNLRFQRACLWFLDGNVHGGFFYQKDGWAPDGCNRINTIWKITVNDTSYGRDL